MEYFSKIDILIAVLLYPDDQWQLRRALFTEWHKQFTVSLLKGDKNMADYLAIENKLICM